MATLVSRSITSRDRALLAHRPVSKTRSGDIVWRIGGAIILVGASMGGFTIRPLSEATALPQLGIGLAAFFAACIGMLFLVRGRAQHDSWRTILNPTAGGQPETDPLPANVRSLLAWDAAMGGRASLATFLILRAQQRAFQPSQRDKPPENLEGAAPARSPEEQL